MFDINPHLTEADLQAIQHEQHAALADGSVNRWVWFPRTNRRTLRRRCR